jgi:hypothetical protein
MTLKLHFWVLPGLVGRVCNVVLIKCTLDLGKPKRGWNFGREGTGGQVKNKGS